MARDLSILVAAKGALKAAREIGLVDTKVKGLGKTGKGLGTAAALGVGAAVSAGAVIIGRSVKSGLENLALLESAVSSVQGAIDQVGIGDSFEKGGLTGTKVAAWAGDIETAIGSAFDDKDITRATGTLIRFGKVTGDNLKPAMQVMTDLATKTGSVDSAASLLAKAMADPTKAAGKLARAGVILTKEQQKQIAAMTKAGDKAGAQKVLLDALAKTTKGAALASQGPYARSLSVLRDVTENAQKALAEGFLPVIEKVRDILSKELAKPETLQHIREFGQGLASGLGHLIEIAQGLPWGSIGDALKIGGAGAKIILDAFVSMPPWVQTAIATGWGLNKLTGGAVSGIVGSLASGLIKGVLGMNAGVVNINAGVVNGGGGGAVPGPAGAGGLGSVLKVFIAGAAVGVIGDFLLEQSKSPAAKAYHDMGGNGTRGFVPNAGSGTVHQNDPNLPQRVALSERTEAILAQQARSMDNLEHNRMSTLISAVKDIKFTANFNITGVAGRKTVRVKTATNVRNWNGKLVPID